MVLSRLLEAGEIGIFSTGPLFSFRSCAQALVSEHLSRLIVSPVCGLFCKLEPVWRCHGLVGDSPWLLTGELFDRAQSEKGNVG